MGSEHSFCGIALVISFLVLTLLPVKALRGGAAALFQLPAGPSTDALKAEFLAKYGDRYGYGGRIDHLYASEIGQRLGPDEHYMDFTAAALYWNSQVANATAQLQQHVFGNPHSASPSSVRTDELVEATRRDLLQFFGADPKEYTLIFTRSGTGALRMLGEAFPWTPQSSFTFLTSNHNSLLGIREYAKAHNASIGSISEAEVEQWLYSTGAVASRAGRSLAAADAPAGTTPDTAAQHAAQDTAETKSGEPAYSLFGYPAYDNYAGVMYPLSWVKEVQARSNKTHVWKVLLDAAAYVPTHKLNLTETPADFVDLSFYKLFGYPTGIGALILRTENLHFLRKLYWGGGSVFLATAALDWRYFRHAPHSYEHGTLPFLDIIALSHGRKVYKQLGGVEAVQAHVAAVVEYLFDELAKLRHSNGAPLVRVFGKHAHANRQAWVKMLEEMHEVQGATINFEVLGTTGRVLGYRQIGAQLGEAGFHIRTGCTCNPGACYEATGVRDEEVRQLAEQKEGHFENWEWIWVHRNKLTKLPLGSLRVSLGMMSRWEDAHALVGFIKGRYTDVEVLEEPLYDQELPSHVYPGWC
ncbi:hypothetical protein N2152v2_005626 [Parachlorella kessleri]